MCIAVLALGQHARFPWVLAANRDEFFDRPAAPLDWWQPPQHVQPILAGRDLSAGGTWLGLSTQGRLALLTNVRDPANQRAEAPSRGRIVPDWLGTRRTLDDIHLDWQRAGHNGFNVIAADLAEQRWGWTDSCTAAPLPLLPGLHGLSNASLDTPWPKVVQLRDAVQEQVSSARALAPLVEGLFAALTNPLRAADHALPDTGLPLAVERALSSVFIRTDDGRYGTRCSTVLVGEQGDARGLRIHVFERTYEIAQGDGELAWTTLPMAGLTGQTTAIGRLPQRGLGYGTTLSSTLMKSSAD